MAEVTYRSNVTITAGQFIDLLNRSTLGQRRPVDDPERIGKMLDHGHVLITAWAGEKLVGVSRALTDFSFCCYLSDLAVDEDYQRQGIGKQLVYRTHEAAGPQTTLILRSVPTALEYYPKIGMERTNDCFIINRKK
jgi:GNAT superfamily N-acetyltransferase